MDIRPTHAARYTRVCNPVKDLNWATSYSRNGSINPHTHSVPPDTYGNYNSLFYHHQQQ